MANEKRVYLVHFSFPSISMSTYVELPLKGSKLGLSKENRKNLKQVLLAVHNERFAFMAPTDHPVQPMGFGIGQQVMEFARKLLGSTDTRHNLFLGACWG